MAGERWTPGPWTIVDRNGYPYQIVHGRDRVTVWGGIAQRTGDGFANAHLIASAPDLYSALEACLDGGVFKHPQTRERALAAMARARGETTT